ncbi:imidazole glycerol phosphate synthase subunit HisF [Idiomarina sp.]|uniref:imidazole glycerol phosphate synthase subunit HisF n=1 Tax=Idiomarina sp. TaxID=1874361 RepID=UPI0025C56D3E|nr:imidazole glycerol phosphate synthase cyclase subunit [Idiomarina sp.]NQZ04621.1 imidazole glycerol phosphate synthase subunit HisF [Idiomarina sp.]
MLKKRVIPVLLLRNGYLVQSKKFSKYQNIGNAIWAVRRMSEWGADELIYLDITQDGQYDAKRDDLRHGNPTSIEAIVREMSQSAFMPMTVGGGIRTLLDIEKRLQWGADKVSLNTLLAEDPKLVEEAAKEFGSQCIVASIDSKRVDGQAIAFTHGGQTSTECTTLDWAKRAEQLGCGEVLLNDIDADGQQTGYNIDLIAEVTQALSIPVIALGGAGEWFDFEDVLSDTQASAVAAANLFHYRDQSVYLAKKHLFDSGFAVRKPELQPFITK